MSGTEPRRIASFCTQCRSRCGCTAVVEDGKLVGLERDPSHPTGQKLCPKGMASPELVHHPDRLTTPMRRVSPKGDANPRWEPLGWDEALSEIAGHMARIRDEHGAEQVAFSVTTPSGTHISDGISWIERFIRAFGSPNSIYGTEICNWHKDIASRLTYGTDIGTPDFAGTDCVLLWGHNPAATWLARSMEVQKAIKRGAKLIVIDPRPTLYARRADCWLRVRPGTDQALALGLLNLTLETSGFDQAFTREWTNAAFLIRDDTWAFLRESALRRGGRDDVILAAGSADTLLRYNTTDGRWLDACAEANLDDVRTVETIEGSVVCRTSLRLLKDAAAAYPPARVAAITGVDEADLRAAAAIIGAAGSVAYYAWNGVGQSVTATQTDRAISILYALTGSYGSAGGNVPGGAAVFNDIAGHDLLSDAQRSKALGFSERPLGPGNHAWVTARDVYRAALEHDPYPVRMLVSFGGNLLSAQPETERAKAAFKALEFHVHTDFFLNATAAHADIVLPVATSWERDGLRTGFDASLEGLRRVQLRPAVIEPVGQARSDVDIVLDLAARLGLSVDMFDGDKEAGHAHILAPSGVTLDELKASPGGVTVSGYAPLRAFESKGFPTPTKRIEIYSEQLAAAGHPGVPSLAPQDEEPTLPSAAPNGYPLRLSCAKTVAFCHSQGRNLPSLRRLAPYPIIELAPELAAARGISTDDWVQISTPLSAFHAKAKLRDGLAPDSVFTQHGWTVLFGDAPEAARGAMAMNMNSALSTDLADPISGSIPLRASWCTIAKA